jgi:hypothetical protein
VVHTGRNKSSIQKPCVRDAAKRETSDSLLMEADVAAGKNVLQVAPMGSEVANLRDYIRSNQRGGVVKTLKGMGIGPVRVVRGQKVGFLKLKAHLREIRIFCRTNSSNPVEPQRSLIRSSIVGG